MSDIFKLISQYSAKYHMKRPFVYWSNKSVYPSFVSFNTASKTRHTILFSHTYDSNVTFQQANIINTLIFCKYINNYLKNHYKYLIFSIALATTLIILMFSLILSSQFLPIILLVFICLACIIFMLSSYVNIYKINKRIDTVASREIGPKRQIKYLKHMISIFKKFPKSCKRQKDIKLYQKRLHKLLK